MYQTRLVCCPYCSKELTRSWNETPSQIPTEEYQTCSLHGVIFTYSWPPSIKEVDVRTKDVIKLFPREKKISPDEIKFLYGLELDKILKYESHNIDWNNKAIYEKCKSYNKNLKKTHSKFINFEMYYQSLHEGRKYETS